MVNKSPCIWGYTPIRWRIEEVKTCTKSIQVTTNTVDLTFIVYRQHITRIYR